MRTSWLALVAGRKNKAFYFNLAVSLVAQRADFTAEMCDEN